jgi:hypothetical protein
MGVWSIMGVEFYGAENPDEFGNFFKSMFTLFQMMTMDSWCVCILTSHAVVRPDTDLTHHTYQGVKHWTADYL